jgi:hypothetical protein
MKVKEITYSKEYKLPVKNKGAIHYALVDKEDYERLNQYSWRLHEFRCAIRTTKKNGKVITIRMHREIMNTPKGMDTDHINGNPLDNRKVNLRICTHQQNSWNVKKHKDGKYRYKGVAFVAHGKRQKRWISQVYCKGKLYRSKYYLTAEEASNWYQLQAKQLFGEYYAS